MLWIHAKYSLVDAELLCPGPDIALDSAEANAEFRTPGQEPVQESRFRVKEPIMNRATFLAALLSAMGLLAITGCNTLEGMGEDTQEAGEEVEEAAE